jgi:hypothetical protein
MPSRNPTTLAYLTALIIAVSISTPAAEVLAGSDSLTPSQRSLRILELEADVRAARKELTDLISEAATPAGLQLRDRPELSAVAEKLARIADELRALRSEIADFRDDGQRR